MKVLILTNPKYKEFIDKVVSPFQSNINMILAYAGEKKISNWDEFNGIGYDVGISFMYQYKVPAKEVNTHTWFNFHPAPLPEYKGRNLCYHAIMNGETEFGATIHYMDENFDTGDIIHVYRFLIYPGDTAGDISRKAIQSCKLLFETMLPGILAGEEFKRIPNVGGKYYPKTEIDDYIGLTDYQDRKLKAITYNEFYPKIDAGGVIYKVVRE